MSYNAAIEKIARDAVQHIDSTTDRSVIGLGSGRAATAVAEALMTLARTGSYNIVGVPTSLQIKRVMENGNCTFPLVEADQVDTIDVVFDGTDQIDSHGYLIKGGGGALLRENVLFNMASKIVVVADVTKFVKNLSREVPVEVHPLARRLVQGKIEQMGGKPTLRILNSGYPMFTENGNIILDCNFGVITDPESLTRSIKQISGVVESGIFLRRPDIVYRAGVNGQFKMITKIDRSDLNLYLEDMV